MSKRKHKFRNKETVVKLIGAEVRFNIEGDRVERWLDRLDHFERQGKNLKPVMDAFGDYMLRSIGRNFAAEGRPDGWEPLAESTVRQRERLGYGGRHPILVRDGTLKNNFRTSTSQTFLRILNDTPYFKYHQAGGGDLPKRVMVILLNQDKARFTRLYRDHMGLR